MKKTFFTLFGVIGLGVFSQSSFACSPNLPNYGNCIRQQQQIQQQQQYYGSQQQNQTYTYQNTPQRVYVYDYLNMLWTNQKDGVYFYKTYRKTPYKGDFDYNQADKNALDACNAHADLRPCKHAQNALGDACIAYMATTVGAFAWTGNTCQEAGQSVFNLCMNNYQEQKICTAKINYTQPIDID